MAPRILQRVACALTADYFRSLHGRHGVIIHESAALLELPGKNGRVTGALMQDGSVIEVGLAVIGIGIAPNTDLAERAGLAVENGYPGGRKLPGLGGGYLCRRGLREFPLARHEDPPRIRPERHRAGRACRGRHARRR
jgi:hypothetical protein